MRVLCADPTYIRAPPGDAACPSGHGFITVETDCESAAPSVGLSYFGESNNGSNSKCVGEDVSDYAWMTDYLPSDYVKSAIDAQEEGIVVGIL